MSGEPSDWVVRWLPAIAPASEVLDLACGAGRHTRLLAGAGHRVTAVDRDPAAIAGLRGLDRVEALVADLEGGPWPFAGRRFGAIVVTRYLHRPLFAPLLSVLDPAGLFIYETFARGNERFGRPSNPAFLLVPGELLEVARLGGLRVIAYEDIESGSPQPAMLQRICARGPGAGE